MEAAAARVARWWRWRWRSRRRSGRRRRRRRWWRRLGLRLRLDGRSGDDDHATLDAPTLRQAARGARERVAPCAAERDLELRAPASTKELATAPRDCETAGAAAAVDDREHRRSDLQLATRDLAGALGHGERHAGRCRRGLCPFGQRNEGQDDAQPDGYARYAPPHAPFVGSSGRLGYSPEGAICSTQPAKTRRSASSITSAGSGGVSSISANCSAPGKPLSR